jgi:hypothetical protein
MGKTNTTMIHYQEYLLHDKEVEKNVLTTITNKNEITPDNFYQTGYECISFKKSSIFALEAVLASVVPMDKSVVILNSGANSSATVETCMKHNINFKVVDFFNNSIDFTSLENLLSSSDNFSHICISLSESTSLKDIDLLRLKEITEKSNTGLFLYYTGDTMNFNRIRKYKIDYLVGNLISSLSSFVLARRNKLVQTEGNARSFSKDLHSLWQQTLRNRRREIEPMYF